MSKILDQDWVMRDEKIQGYVRARQALPHSKPVSQKRAMKQILRYSREQRLNVYGSTRAKADGVSILKTSR